MDPDELSRLPASEACRGGVGRVGSIGGRFKDGGLGVRSDDLRSKNVGDIDVRTLCVNWDLIGTSSQSVLDSVLTIFAKASVSLERPRVRAMSEMAVILSAVAKIDPV